MIAAGTLLMTWLTRAETRTSRPTTMDCRDAGDDLNVPDVSHKDEEAGKGDKKAVIEVFEYAAIEYEAANQSDEHTELPTHDLPTQASARRNRAP